MTSAEKYDFLADVELQKMQRAADEQGSAPAFAVLAEALNVRGIFPRALQAAEQSTSLDPEHFNGWFEYAIAASATGEEHLLKILDTTRELLDAGRGDSGELKTALALASYYMGDDEAATELANEAITAVSAGDIESHAHEVLGYIAYNRNDFETARAHFVRAIEVDDKNYRAHWMVGHCMFELNKLGDARRSYSRAVELEPYFANAWFSLGKVYLVEDELQPAYQCLGKTVSINPRMWDCYFTQADYYLGHGAYNSAIASCHRILELMPGGDVASEAFNYVGEIYLVMRDFATAQRYFEEAISFEPENAAIYNNLGVALLKQERIDEAKAQFRKAMERDSSYAYPVTKMGHAYLMQRNYRKAEEMFRRAVSIDPSEYWAWLGLSELHRRQRRYRDQLAAVHKALEIEENDSDVYNYLGIAFESVREPDKAEAAYLRSLELDPYNRKAANNLGYLYEKFLQRTGDDEYRSKAINAWKRRLLICRDSNTSTLGARRHLRSLGVDVALIDRWMEGEELHLDGSEA